MPQSPIRVLSIEDDAHDAERIREALASRPGRRVSVTCAETLADGLVRLDENAFDAALIDLSLPDAHGIEVVRRMRREMPDVPVVVLSSLDDEEHALKAVQSGAQSFLSKETLNGETLERTLRHAIERHRLVTSLDESRRRDLERKDEFLSHVSHEFRTPLSAIHQFATILLDGLAGELSDDQREYLGVVLRNARQLRRMIEDLLEVTRASAGRLLIERVRMPVAPVVTEVTSQARAQAEEAGITLGVQLEEGLEILADPARMRQVVANLVDNAIKYTPTGGRITVSARRRGNDGERVCIAVKDTGCGIPYDQVDAVFERMYQCEMAVQEHSRKGLGLGLYISRELVTLQGGHMWVESEPGQGSTFSAELASFSLPRLLEPLFDDSHRGAAHLVTVETTPRGRPARPKIAPSVLRAVRRVVERCATEHHDVVLPSVDEHGDARVVLVVSCGRPAEVRQLIAAIVQAANACPDFDDTEYELSVNYHLIEDESTKTLPSEARARQVAGSVEERLGWNTPVAEPAP